MSWNFEEALDYYRRQGAPADQNALKNLLTEIQQEQGGRIPTWALPRIADAYGIRETFLSAVIKRYPSLKADTEHHLLELCGGSGCSKRGHLAEFVEKTYGKNPAGFSVKITPCMHMCGQGPMLRWDGELHCGADETLIRSLVSDASSVPAAEPVPGKSEKASKKDRGKDSIKEKTKDPRKKEKKEAKDKKKKKDK